jgi:hypothetical protein
MEKMDRATFMPSTTTWLLLNGERHQNSKMGNHQDDGQVHALIMLQGHDRLMPGQSLAPSRFPMRPSPSSSGLGLSQHRLMVAALCKHQQLLLSLFLRPAVLCANWFRILRIPQACPETLFRLRCGVYGLFGGFETCTFGLHGSHDVLKVPDTAGQPINAGDHQGVALTEEVQHSLQFGAACRRCAASLFRSDNIAASSLQGCDLDFKILVCG